jgi:glycosyltransferase involved in cell wall biosynthesis
MKNKRVFVVWTKFQRRAETICGIMGIELFYVPRPFASQWLLPLSYLHQAWQTLVFIASRKPDEVWIQTPPTFLPHLLVGARALLRGPWRIVVDCHNATFRVPWNRMPLLLDAINRCDRIAVHNEEVFETAVSVGLSPTLLEIVEDPPANLKVRCATDDRTITIVTPCSFREDEPIEELLGTARRLPLCSFYLTGDVERAHRRGLVAQAPSNVTFTGFMPVEEFDRLIERAHVVLGLTTIEGIQLSVANEAVGAGRALVLSDTSVLRKLFGDAALFSRNTSDALVTTIETALRQREHLQARSEILRERRLADWRDKVMNCASK